MTMPSAGAPAPFVPGQAMKKQLLAMQRRHAVPVIVLPFVALVVAMVLGWGRTLGPVDLALFLGMYVVSMLGITVGYHRLLTHRSFDCGDVVKGALVVAAAFAAEGPPLFWVAAHRKHHQFSDAEGDPHSPHRFGGGLRGTLRGYLHAHVGWMLTEMPPDPLRYAPDLLKQKLVMKLHKQYLRLVVLGLVLPTLIGLVAIGGFEGALRGLLWGGLVRMFFVQHVTWSINSLCHGVGACPYEVHDESRNNALFGVLALGEGWHNNHHAFPSSARHGIEWYQLDLSWLFILTLKACGLATQVVVPDERHRASRRAGVVTSESGGAP